MSKTGARFSRFTTDIRTGIVFCTRLPVAPLAFDGAGIARASWAFPVAGALVGFLGAVVYWLAYVCGLPAWPAAALALAATLVATGCLHEDGLADTADGFGGGATRERKLEIMRDSRIGTFGVCALTMSLVLRWSALATLADPEHVTAALIASHAAARATMPALMTLVPPARQDGLSAAAGRPSRISAAIAISLGAIALVLGLGLWTGLLAAVLLLLVLALTVWLCLRQIGGQTGDVLGALEQAGEIVILLAAVAWR